MNPLIGITTTPKMDGNLLLDRVPHEYASSVQAAGGLPLLIPTLTDAECIDAYIDRLDGILLSGGDADVDPARFGEDPVRELRLITPERDVMEIELFLRAFERDLPVLAICRGIQVVNVAAGGSLIQDIPSQVTDAIGHFPRGMDMHLLYHRVKLESGSRVHEIFGTTDLRVNSFHHQAVKAVAPGFRVTARSADGVIEAIELPDKRFMVGIQWHPETLTAGHSQFLNLFKAFVAACAEG